MKNKKTAIHIVAILGILTVCVLSLSFIKSSFINGATTKTAGYFINDIFDTPAPVLQNKATFKHDFVAQGDIYGVKVRFNNKGKPQKGDMLVEVCIKNSDKALLSKTVNSETLLNDAYTAINFDTPYLNTDTEEYTLKLTPSFDIQDAYMSIWQESESQNIAMGIISSIVDGKKVFAWFNILSVSVIVAAVLIYLACFVFKIKAETAFVISILSASFIFNIVLPPYSSPDEQAHINSAYLLSNKMFDANLPKQELDNYTIYKRSQDTNKIMQDRYTTVFSYEYIYDNFFATQQDKTLVANPNEWAVGDFPAVYFLGAIAIKIGRVLNIGFVPLLYLGRMFNLAFFVLCAYFAIKITPIGKEIFMILSFLPITLHLVNSFSRDAFVISVAFIFVAYLLYLLFAKQDYNIKHILLLVFIGVMLAPSKMIYVCMCPLALLLIKKRIKIPKIKQIPTKYLALSAAVLSVVLFAIIFFVAEYGQYFAMMFVSKESFEQLLQQNPEATYNLALIIKNPMVTAKLLLNTLFSNLTYYIKSIAGGVLSYNSVQISDTFTFTFLFLMFVSTFKAKREKYRLTAIQKTSFFAVFAVILAIVVYLGISWTPVSAVSIYGIQGKYLLPALPIFLIAVKNDVFTVEKDIFKPMCFIAASVNIFVALNALVVISQR